MSFFIFIKLFINIAGSSALWHHDRFKNCPHIEIPEPHWSPKSIRITDYLVKTPSACLPPANSPNSHTLSRQFWLNGVLPILALSPSFRACDGQQRCLVLRRGTWKPTKFSKLSACLRSNFQNLQEKYQCYYIIVFLRMSATS